MYPANLPRAAVAICFSIMAIGRASAQDVVPTNDTTSVNTTTQFIMDTILEMTSFHFPLLPLTAQAGLQGSLPQLEVDRHCSPKSLDTSLTF